MSFLFEEDSNNPTNGDLSKISRLAKLQIKLQKEVEEKEEALKDANNRLKQVQQYDLPLCMSEIGMSTFSLDTGEKITVKKEVKASIPKHFLNDALAWLRENGAGAIIKNDVTVSFRTDEDEDALNLVSRLEQEGFPVQNKQTVHASTLAAFVREKIENQEEFPREIFGVFTFDKAVIKV